MKSYQSIQSGDFFYKLFFFKNLNKLNSSLMNWVRYRERPCRGERAGAVATYSGASRPQCTDPLVQLVAYATNHVYVHKYKLIFVTTVRYINLIFINSVTQCFLSKSSETARLTFMFFFCVYVVRLRKGRRLFIIHLGLMVSASKI